MMQKAYSGEILSLDGLRWRIDIITDRAEAVTPEALTFDGSEPVVITWERREKYEPLCGSSATLRLDSPGDRTYTGLYTIAPLGVRLEIYREDALYWVGHLDPETYEEPYQSEKHYTVELTFTDFGIWERLDTTLYGTPSVKAVLSDALRRAGLDALTLDASRCSTNYAGNPAADFLDALYIPSSNFYDEEGAPSKVKDVVADVLQPLALKIRQQAGRAVVYDLNAIHSESAEAIHWQGPSSTLGVDRVASKAKISFSPYSTADLIAPDRIKYTLKPDPGANVAATAMEGQSVEQRYWGVLSSYNPDLKKDGVFRTEALSFQIFAANEGEGLASRPSVPYFHIASRLSGPAECDGIASCIAPQFSDPVFNVVEASATKPQWPSKANEQPLMCMQRVYLPPMADNEFNAVWGYKYYLRLRMEMLLDPRYNPFEEANEYNEKGDYMRWANHVYYAFVPFSAVVYDSAGLPLCHYDNKMIAGASADWRVQLTCGEWKSGQGTPWDAWMQWYAPNPTKDHASGVLGWQANRQAMGRPNDPAFYAAADGPFADAFANALKPQQYDSFREMPDGQFLPYPPQGGWLEICVYNGVALFDDCDDLRSRYRSAWKDLGSSRPAVGDICAYKIVPGSLDPEGLSRWGVNPHDTEFPHYSDIRWLLYKAPSLTIVSSENSMNAVTVDDVEYSGWINHAAKEEIAIDTTCGTAPDGYPMNRGAFMSLDASRDPGRLCRGGVTDSCERLLIGTLMSQYDRRHTTLTGECALLDSAAMLFSESHQEGKAFMLMSDRQDIATDTSTAEFCELSAEEYKAIDDEGI